MDRDPGSFKRHDDASGDTAAERREAFSLEALPMDAPDAVGAAIAEARADLAAGRGVPHAEVAQWLATWGTPDYKPIPAEWLK